MPWIRKIPWRRGEVFLPGESHRQMSLSGLRSIGCKESDTSKQLTHFSIVTSGNYCFYLLGCFIISKSRSKEEEKNPCGRAEVLWTDVCCPLNIRETHSQPFRCGSEHRVQISLIKAEERPSTIRAPVWGKN